MTGSKTIPQHAFARVDVHTDAASVDASWALLEDRVPCSIYQTRRWLQPWAATLGRRTGLSSLFIEAKAIDEHPVALFCLGVVRRGAIRIAMYLGGKDANFNLALMEPSDAWTASEIRRLLAAAARSMGRDAPDVFVLVNQPFSWQGAANPLAALPHQASPSAAYGTALPSDPDHLFANKLSKETRKKLRKKEAKLASLGCVEERVAATVSERRRIVEAFLAQKVNRFRDKGIDSDFGSPAMTAFLEAAIAPTGTGIDIHGLFVGDRIVATYGGASHQGQWSGMFNSFDADDEIAKTSPGDLLLMRIMTTACRQGLTRFDLGIGEARYKAALCDEMIPLFDTIVPISPLGAAYARYVAARQYAKRLVKRTPWLYRLALAVRTRLRSK